MTVDDLITHLRQFDINQKVYFIIPDDVEAGDAEGLEVNDIFEEDDGLFVVLG